jgi:hypothetical protein
MPPARKVPTFRRACCLRLHRTKVRNAGVRVGTQQQAKATIPLQPLKIILFSSPQNPLASVFDSHYGGGRFSEAPVRFYQITRRQIRYFITFKKV